MASANSLVVNLTAKTSAFERGIARARRRIAAFATYAKRTLTGIGRTLMNPATVLGGFAAGAGVGGMVKLAADAEALQIQLEVLTGSAAKATQLVSEMTSLAIESPFDRMQLVEGTKTMIQFGIASQDASKHMESLSQIAAGDAERLSRLTLAFSQSAAAGKLMGQDVLQMVNAGFNPMLEISRKTGESMTDLRVRMERGGIAFAEVAAAFESATAEGGRFYGMNERMAATTTGRWMKLKEQAANIGRTIGATMLPPLNDIMDSLIAMSPQITEFGQVFGVVITNLGQTFAVAFETAKGYASAAFSFIIDSAAVMVQNVAISISNVFAELKAYLQNIGEQAAVALGLADQALNVQAAPGRALLQMPEFKAPELGPIAKDFAVKIEKAITPPEMPALDMEAIDAALSVGDVRRGESQAMQTKAAGALQRGSAEAYSAIVQAMMGSGDPTVSAIQKMQKAIVDQLKKNAPKNQQVELVGDLTV